MKTIARSISLTLGLFGFALLIMGANTRPSEAGTALMATACGCETGVKGTPTNCTSTNCPEGKDCANSRCTLSSTGTYYCSQINCATPADTIAD